MRMLNCVKMNWVVEVGFWGHEEDVLIFAEAQINYDIVQSISDQNSDNEQQQFPSY